MGNLYSAQEKIWNKVFENEALLGIPHTLLCGGTALARFHLHHRLSYGLDFFTPIRFNPEALLLKLGSIGIEISEPIIESRSGFCRQLTGLVNNNGEPVKIDFVEDIYQGMFDVMNEGLARTEVIDGLYHRKIRTVSDVYSKDGRVKGSRQTARDSFDLHVLSQSVEPLSKFVARINSHGANIPIEGLCSGILSMPWIDLMDDFGELEKLNQWVDCEMLDVRRSLEKEALFLQNQEMDNYHGTGLES